MENIRGLFYNGSFPWKSHGQDSWVFSMERNHYKITLEYFPWKGHLNNLKSVYPWSLADNPITRLLVAIYILGIVNLQLIVPQKNSVCA